MEKLSKNYKLEYGLIDKIENSFYEWFNQGQKPEIEGILLEIVNCLQILKHELEVNAIIDTL